MAFDGDSSYNFYTLSYLMSCSFTKVAEMDVILQQHNNTMPSRDVLVSLAEKFRCAFISFNMLIIEIVLVMHLSFDVVSQWSVKAR